MIRAIEIASAVFCFKTFVAVGLRTRRPWLCLQASVWRAPALLSSRQTFDPIDCLISVNDFEYLPASGDGCKWLFAHRLALPERL
jgi:hypothetical protein